MKRVKRILIVVSIAAILASEGYAVDLCTIPVYMNFGTKGKKTYFGCEDFHIKADFPVRLGWKYTVYNVITNKNWDVYFEPDEIIPGDENYYERSLCLMISKIKMAKKVKVPPGSKNVLIGTFTITYEDPEVDHLIELEENPLLLKIVLDQIK
jgi:hypothetical protein